jgi:hypothetical protein
MGERISEARRHWLGHLRAWSGSGGSIRAYAESAGLDVAQLYAWRTRLRKLGLWRDEPAAGARFHRVELKAAAAGSVCRLRLPSGVVVEFEDFSLGGLPALLAALGQGR